jgi:uncharacterized protein YceK
MNMNLLLLGLAFALVLTGCASIKPQPSLNASGPASPNAAEGAYAMASPVLMAGTNYALPPQPEQQPNSDHSTHGQAKQPAQGHEHHEP